MQRMKTRFYIIIFLIFLLAACGMPADREKHRLAMLEQVVNELPDRAIVLIDSMEHESSSWTRSGRMNLLLLKGEAMNKSFLPLDTLSFATELLEYFRRHGSSLEEARALYLMGNHRLPVSA